MQSRILRLLAALLALTLIASACGDDDDPIADDTDDTTADDTAADDTPADDDTADEPGTIVDVAVGAGSFTTLVAAVTEAGLAETLSGPGPFTVFAPTDEAFEAALTALGITAEELLARDDLADILTYHVVAGEVDAAAAIALDGQTAPTVNGAEIDITVVDGSVMINDATVTTADVAASNGIIHIIDTVLLPPADEMGDDDMADDEAMDEPGTIVDIAAGNENFSILVAALTEAGLVDTLNGEGPFTVFAPTDEAFEAAIAALDTTAEELLAREDLAAILTYHVIGGAAVFSADVTDGQTAATVNGAELTIGVSEAGPEGGVTINEANVVAADVEASNGVIHIIDTVLLPPA